MATKKETFEQVLEQAQTPKTIHYKIWRAKQEIGKVVKGNDNPFFKSKYADLNAILEAVEPSLHKHNLIVLQPCIGNMVETQIIDIETGNMVNSYLELPEISDPQKRIAAVTYFRRATLQSLMSLQAIDDDGNTAREAVSKPTLTPERFIKAFGALKEGSVTIDQIIEKYTLTDGQRNKLNEVL